MGNMPEGRLRMGIIAKGSEMKEFEKATPGMHRAVCISMVDLGVQSGEYNGEPWKKRQVALIFELDQCFTEGNYTGEPMLVSEIVTLSLNEKAKLRGYLESWRGKRFSEQELLGYDISEWVGSPCMINVMHNAKGYAKIAGISPLMAGLEPLAPVRLGYVPDWIKRIANNGEGDHQRFDVEEKPGNDFPDF